MLKQLNRKSLLRGITGVALLATAGLIPSFAAADVILHAFDWKYQDVESRAEEIARLGYRKVLVAPPLKSDKYNGYWWARYQPQDYRIIDNHAGNKDDFVDMVNALRAANVEVYADIVFNQMANERGNSLHFPGNDTLRDYATYDYFERQKIFGDLRYGLFEPSDFNLAINPDLSHTDRKHCITRWHDQWQSQNLRICGDSGPGLPDLKPNNWVIEQHRNYIQALKNMGVTGMRIDAAKHMPIDYINRVFSDDMKQGLFLFAEIITGSGAGDMDYDTFLAPYLAYTSHSAYDFPLFRQIRNAFSPNGSLQNLVDPYHFGQSLHGFRAVTFAITHDIPLNNGFRRDIMNIQEEHLANTYVMGRDGGQPLVFSDTTGTDNGRWVDDYRQANITAMIRFHNQVQGQYQEVLYSDQCVLVFRRGQEGLVGINKCGDERWIELETSSKLKWYHDYVDVFTGETIWINDHRYAIRIPARDSRMWLSR